LAKAKGKKKTVEGKETLCNVAVLRDRGKETNGRILSRVYGRETTEI
jgi:hypothetical protein